MKKKMALDVRGLTVHYGSSPVLWDLNVAVPEGHIVGIIGPNGAGKTTFIRAVLGLMKGVVGSVQLLESSLDDIRHRVAYVPQKETVDWTFPMRVRDLVEMGCYPRKGLFCPMGKEEKRRVDMALDLLDLVSIEHVQIGQLSGGQQQRAFLARAMAQRADIYFLDEPFCGIDQISEQILVDVLHSMREQKKTIFVVHHDLISAREYFDWAVLLNTRLIASGQVDDVFTHEYLHQTYGHKLSLVDDLLKISSAYSEGRHVDDGNL